MIKQSLHALSISCAMLMMLLLVACKGEQFQVSGSITNAKDSVLYFEHNGLDGFAVLDSVKLDDKGEFSFSDDKVSNPEFYRLRIAGQIINIGIDSAEVVDVKASYPLMATNYEVKGSYENEKIKELALKQIQLQNDCNQLLSQGTADADQQIEKLIADYKLDVERNYIFKEPMKGYAYFALFQYVVIGNQPRMIFDPRRDAKDNKVFGAVATSWDTFYPGSERGLNLHNITLKGMRDERIVQNNNRTIEIDSAQVQSLGVIPINLDDNKGNTRRLTDLKGKVVMLDFHVFASDASTKRIMQLRELYNKYHAQGFEIYQVSLDPNEHFWKTSTANLPWICVWDPEGQNSDLIASYNLQTVPTFFLIDRNNKLQKRDVQISDLDKEIQSMLH